MKYFSKLAYSLPLALLLACQNTTTTPQTPYDRIGVTENTIAECATTACKTLNLDSGDLPDFSVIATMDHVTALRMSWTDFDDLADIAAMQNLRELHISSTQISDLSGLSAFRQLDILHVQWSRNVTDFSPIGRVTTLTELALGGNDVGDMPYVAALTNLDGLSLTSSTVSDMGALANHPTLSRLDLEMATLPDDISALLSIPNLRLVSVTPERLTDEHMAVVQALRAKGVQVDEIAEAVVVIC